MLKGLVAWWARNPVAGNLLMFALAAALVPLLLLLDGLRPRAKGEPPTALQAPAGWPGPIRGSLPG